MDEVDNFPFDSVEDFENAVDSMFIQEKQTTHPFAFAPPIHTSHLVSSPTVESPRNIAEEEKKKSPHARNFHGSKEWIEEIHSLEGRIDEKFEQLLTLYYYAIDKIKQLERNTLNK